MSVLHCYTLYILIFKNYFKGKEKMQHDAAAIAKAYIHTHEYPSCFTLTMMQLLLSETSFLLIAHAYTFCFLTART